MALVLKDRVKEQSTTTGTGTLTLSGAFDGYQAFSAIGDGNVTYYTIYDPATGDWEVGYGMYTASGTTLSRDSVYDSSNSGNLVSFVAGTKEVFCTYPSEQAVYQETNGNLRLISGVIEVSLDGTSGTTLPNATFQAFATQNGYIQNNIQNLSGGVDASSDFVATNDHGDDSSFYVDVGINSSGFNSTTYPIYSPNSGYLYSVGDGAGTASDLFVGSGDGDVILHAGGFNTTHKVATYSGTDQSATYEADLNVGGNIAVTGAAIFGSTVALNQDPTTALQAATKQYVDNAVSAGLTIHAPVRVEASTNLNATYNNGTAGVGATLTNAGAQTAIEIGGVTLSLNDRVLVYQQTTQTQNGVYYVSNVGSGSTNWVLTRATDADSYGVADPEALGQGSYFFVQEGTPGSGESYVCNTDGVIVFGTTAITFALFSTAPQYIVESPLDLTGNTLSLAGIVSATHGGTGTNTVTTGDLLYGSAPNTWSKLAAGSQYRVLTMGASAPEWNAVALNQTNAVSGSLGATNGGTGQSSYTVGDLLYSSATNTLSKLAGNTTTTKKYLNQTGTGSASQAPTWGTIDASDIASGTLAVARGGTGLSSYAVGDIVYASGTGTLARLADVATGNVLLSGGTNTAPVYGKVNLGTHITGTLPLGNGGTGQTTAQAAINSLVGAVTSGSYLRGNGTNVVMSTIQAADVPTLNQNTTGSAGSVVSALTINNGGAGDVSGTTFNGSAARTISYNTIGASPLAGSSSLTTTGTVTSGTWSASFGAVSGANLTNLTAGNLSGTIPSAVLGNSTHYIGTTAVALNRASANQGLTGITSITMPGSSSGTATLTPAAAAGTTAITIPATSGTLITTGDTGTVTNTMLAGSIANAKLANSSVTINGSAVSLGGSITVTATATNALTMNNSGAGAASGTTFNGSAAQTISYNTIGAPSTTGTNASGTWNIAISGNAATATNASYAYNYTQSFASNWNTDFQNTPAGSVKIAGDTSTGSSTGGPGGTWWFQENMRHTNGTNYWGVQVAWGWEDNANVLKTRNVQGGAFGSWVTYINSNNIGSQSVASATNATNATNLTGTAGTCGYSTAGATIAYTGAGGPQVMGSTTNAAMISLHRLGAYAVNFGLDTDNVLKVGGWSMGGVAYPIVHTGSSNLVTRAMMYKGSNDGAAVLCGADGAIFLNPNTISNSTTIPASYNGVSAGPITIATGVTVTVSTGANWVIT